MGGGGGGGSHDEGEARGAGGRRRPGEGAGGGTPPAQLGGMGERCKLPQRGLGQKPTLFALKDSENYAKKKKPCDLRFKYIV